MSRPPATVVLLTPPGRGAVATLLVEGPAAVELADTFFHSASGRSIDSQAIGKILFGRWGTAQGEEIVVCRRRDERVEVHCHGGAAAAAKIIADLKSLGAREAAWRDWITASEPDPIRAAAMLALAETRTHRTAAVLLDQYAGALSRAIVQIVQRLRAGDRTAAEHDIRSLLGVSNLGLHLTRPWRIVLAGRPNVGKSSLMNALVGYQRAIVFDLPGTTRDVVTATTAIDGWPIELADTAGLRETNDPLESEGVQRTQLQLASADLVVLVADGSQPWSQEDQHLLEAAPSALLVYNKSDLPQAGDSLCATGSARARPAGLSVSALQGSGIDVLLAEIAARLIPQTPAPGTAIPFNDHQVMILTKAFQLTHQGEAASAENLLRRLLTASP